MNIIKEVSSTIPRQIAVAVNLATDGTPEEVEQQLPAIIASVLAAAEMCKNAAEDAENAFANVAGLAQVKIPTTVPLKFDLNGPRNRKWSLRARIKYVKSDCTRALTLKHHP